MGVYICFTFDLTDGKPGDVSYMCQLIQGTTKARNSPSDYCWPEGAPSDYLEKDIINRIGNHSLRISTSFH
jgi:hypothetical protein